MNDLMDRVDWLAFGSLIRARRDGRQMSQAALGKILGISQAAISLIERGSPTGLTADRFHVLLSSLEIAESELPEVQKIKPAAAGNHIFISYSHKDKVFLDRLMVHLRPLEKRKLIDPWADNRIVAGDKWKTEIASSLKKARAAILLISADFLASDFIVDNELPPLLKKADESGTFVIPVVLKPCRFAREVGLATFQSINSPEEPISGLDEHERELVYDSIALRLERLFENKS